MAKKTTTTEDDDGLFDDSPAALREAMERGANDGSAGRLKSLIQRVERLEEEKAGIAADIKEIYAEAKGTGFDTKIMRQVIRRRKMEQADRVEQDELLDLYERAIGDKI
jgi:uncharacterized protein (UPF0335 family)